MCVSTAPWTNHHIVYCYSEDDARTWRNNAGVPVATTGPDPVTVNDRGIHVPRSTHDSRNAIRCYDMAVGPNGLIGYLPDHVSPSPLGGPDGCVQTMDQRFALANEQPRWRTVAGGWPAVTIKIDGVEPRCDWPAGRKRAPAAFAPNGDTVVIYSGARVVSARASTGYTDWRLDVDGTRYFNAFGDFQIDRSREAEGVLSVLYIEQAPAGATRSAVCVRDILLES